MSSPAREAVILAAGVGKRLHPFTEYPHKCLLTLGGRSLIERHLTHLASGGVERVVIVVGHNGDAVREHVTGLNVGVAADFVENPEYTHGSVLSLEYGLRALGETDHRVVWMDADVLYHADILHRLLRSEPPLCFLLDPTAEESGEEMMLGVKAGRVLHIDRGVGPGGWDVTGESVGFFAADPAIVRTLLAKIADFRAAGRLDAEYEHAVHEILPGIEAGYVEAGDFPWTEIDFPADVEKAKSVLEELRGLGVE